MRPPVGNTWACCLNKVSAPWNYQAVGSRNAEKRPQAPDQTSA